MAKVPNGVEILPKISIASVGCTNVTDRRQTDGRRHIANMNMSSRSLKTCTLTSRSCLELQMSRLEIKRFVSVSSRLVKPTSRSREVSVSVPSQSWAFTCRAHPCISENSVMVLVTISCWVITRRLIPGKLESRDPNLISQDPLGSQPRVVNWAIVCLSTVSVHAAHPSSAKCVLRGGR